MEVTITTEMPEVLDDTFAVSNNEDWSRDYRLTKDDAPVQIGNDWKFFMQMVGPDGSVLINATSDNNRIVVIDKDDGKFGLRVKEVDASQAKPAQYDYDIILVSDVGISRVVKGIVTVENGITQIPGQEKWTHFPLISRP